MGWNFRVVRCQGPEGPWLGIFEVYYDRGGTPNARTTDAVTVTSDAEDGIAGLQWQLEQMFKAVAEPVLDDAIFQPKDTTPAEPPARRKPEPEGRG